MVGAGRQQLLVLGLHATVGLLVIIAATVLTALHDLDAQAAVALFGAAVGLAGGSAGAVAALGTAVNGKSIVSEGSLSRASQLTSHAISELGGSRREVDAGALREAHTAPTEPPADEPNPGPAA